MGNLYAESGLYPDRVQGDIPYSDLSVTYTQNVDNGSISEYDFVHNGPNGGGYGLAQWTFYSRKQALYDMKQEMGVSIGSIDLALAYLWQELITTYPTVLNSLVNATSVRMASDVVLFDFENPADQSESVQEHRASLGQVYYDLYADGDPPIEPPDDDSLYKLISATPYKLGQLTESETSLLKTLTIGDTVFLKFTFNRNKKQIGTNFTNSRLTFDNLPYIVNSVGKNGFLVIRYNNTGMFKYLNPKYIKL